VGGGATASAGEEVPFLFPSARSWTLFADVGAEVMLSLFAISSFVLVCGIERSRNNANFRIRASKFFNDVVMSVESSED
jgi:hypothetical protein